MKPTPDRHFQVDATYAITLSLSTILRARYNFCYVFGQNKANILKILLTTSPSNEYPASVLRLERDDTKLSLQTSQLVFSSVREVSSRSRIDYTHQPYVYSSGWTPQTIFPLSFFPDRFPCNLRIGWIRTAKPYNWLIQCQHHLTFISRNRQQLLMYKHSMNW